MHTHYPKYFRSQIFFSKNQKLHIESYPSEVYIFLFFPQSFHVPHNCFAQYQKMDKIIYLDKEYEMLKRCVQVRLFSKLYNFTEMLMINMGIHSKQTFQDRLGDG